ncbi:HAD family hydrolase [Jatrophihabitans sp.]|uniref:HAD family hydrolase n=1 Tax=Jatrophihabitans sp. TaxID=1932789 RepID=UPI0030C74978|nr:hydrolase [Jatrophihabitans sp.]
MRISGRQTLIFDADDTLWENNILFERVIDDFTEWLAHPTLDPAQIRAIFDEIEAANTVTHGYGSTVFLGSLRDCFAHLNERPVTDAERAEIEGLAAALVRGDVELIPAVAETLDELGSRHDLLLMTKGVPAEQQRKLDVSGLGRHFAAINIVPEKDVSAYRALIARHGLDPAESWMIGNSPKSDILPARAVGMRAVFIPNVNTWILEHASLDEADRGVLTLDSFGELTTYF